MKVAVWDTYVTKTDGTVMNFDILVPESQKDAALIYGYGKQYLKAKSVINYELTAKECSFCHVEQATEDMIHSINKNGYHIVELRNC